MLRVRQEAFPGKWIFPNLFKPEQPVFPDAVYRRLKSLLCEAGITESIPFHALRHSKAMHMLQAGTNLVYILIFFSLFKPELEVFLAARTPSIAAVAQQKLDAVWAVLAQLPAYKNFAPYSHGLEGLFHSMREHPGRIDDSVTEGTNFHRVMTY